MVVSFVLVPGAWLGGWAWARVSPLLESQGHVYPVTLTGMGERVHLASPEHGIETAVQDVLNVLSYNDLEDVVLVGHSFAGKVVAPVADRASDRVRLILYVDALRPDKVRTPQGGFDPTKEFGSGPPGSFTVPLSEKVIDTIGPDVKGADREWLLSKATPWPVKPAMEPITLSNKFDSVESAYIFCSKSGDPVDEIISGKWGKLEGPHRVIESGHWPMITMPDELADDIISLTGLA
jgi:pimeloyl-ACP methyl ester carboxylesterase